MLLSHISHDSKAFLTIYQKQCQNVFWMLLSQISYSSKNIFSMRQKHYYNYITKLFNMNWFLTDSRFTEQVFLLSKIWLLCVPVTKYFHLQWSKINSVVVVLYFLDMYLYPLHWPIMFQLSSSQGVSFTILAVGFSAALLARTALQHCKLFEPNLSIHGYNFWSWSNLYPHLQVFIATYFCAAWVSLWHLIICKFWSYLVMLL